MTKQRNLCWQSMVVGLSVLCLLSGVGCKKTNPPAEVPTSLPTPPRLHTSKGGSSDTTPSRPPVPLTPEQRQQQIALSIRQILGGKQGENNQLLQALNTLRASTPLQQEAIPLLARQLQWESGRRACHLLVALHELTKNPKEDIAVPWLSAKGDKPSVRDLDCPEKIQLKKIRLDRLQLVRAKLPYAHLVEASLQKVNLEQGELNHANLRSAQLSESNLQEAQLNHTNLTLAHLNRTRLNAAQLKHATLVGSRLERADLRSANLQHADLSAAVLLRANFRKADLRNARLLKAQLQGAQWQGAQLQGALFSASAQRALRSFRKQSICIRDILLQPCKLWLSAPPSAQTPASPDPSGSCPSTPLRGPIFVFTQEEYDNLSSRQQKKLQTFRCP